MAEKKGFYSKKLNTFHRLSLELISLADKGTLISDYLKSASEKIIKMSDAAKLNIIISDIRNYYRFTFYNNGEWKIFPLSGNVLDPELLIKKESEATTSELEKAVLSENIKKSSVSAAGNKGLYIRNTGEPFLLTVKAGKKGKELQVKVKTGYSSILILPVKNENEIIGVVSLEWTNKQDLNDEDISFFQYIFEILGSARSHRQAKFHLGERVKELSTIYQITHLGAEINKSLDDVLSGAVDIIPPGFLRPELACCKIVYSNEEFKSRNYEIPKHILREDIVVGGENIGYIEVGYTQEANNLDKGPFLKEERPMLMTVARELSLIAERKQFQDERERFQQQLLHADRLVTVGQLTAGVAHELNEPLGGILGFAQLIKKYGDINESVARDIDKIINASLHAREIIRKLMLFSRQTPPEKKLFDINERINDGLYLLENRINKSNIVLVREFSEDLPLIKLDPSQINQVLVNLVVNAIQAMPDGGTLTIKTDKSINAVVLVIADTGIGMTPEQIDRIFIPFFTTKDINEGTGLGLPVALGIVQSHGGTINVKSLPGRGSEFIIKFPIENGNNSNQGTKK